MLLLLLFLSINAQSINPSNAAPPYDYTCSVLRQSNAHRASKGQPPLMGDVRLDNAAMVQCQNMVKLGKLEHETFGTTPSDRIDAQRYNWQGCAENIYNEKGYSVNPEFERAVNAWIKSPGHEKNMVGDYVHHGSASCVASDGTIYWAQEFAKGDYKAEYQYDCNGYNANAGNREEVVRPAPKPRPPKRTVVTEERPAPRPIITANANPPSTCNFNALLQTLDPNQLRQMGIDAATLPNIDPSLLTGLDPNVLFSLGGDPNLIAACYGPGTNAVITAPAAPKPRPGTCDFQGIIASLNQNVLQQMRITMDQISAIDVSSLSSLDPSVADALGIDPALLAACTSGTNGSGLSADISNAPDLGSGAPVAMDIPMRPSDGNVLDTRFLNGNSNGNSNGPLNDPGSLFTTYQSPPLFDPSQGYGGGGIGGNSQYPTTSPQYSSGYTGPPTPGVAGSPLPFKGEDSNYLVSNNGPPAGVGGNPIPYPLTKITASYGNAYGPSNYEEDCDEPPIDDCDEPPIDDCDEPPVDDCEEVPYDDCEDSNVKDYNSMRDDCEEVPYDDCDEPVDDCDEPPPVDDCEDDYRDYYRR